MQLQDELIEYTAQTIAKNDSIYYFSLIRHFNKLSEDELENQICEYTELTLKNIRDREYIISNVLPKLKDYSWTKTQLKD